VTYICKNGLCTRSCTQWQFAHAVEPSPWRRVFRSGIPLAGTESAANAKRRRYRINSWPKLTARACPLAVGNDAVAVLRARIRPPHSLVLEPWQRGGSIITAKARPMLV
jgi:hypothetical protein